MESAVEIINNFLTILLPIQLTEKLTQRQSESRQDVAPSSV